MTGWLLFGAFVLTNALIYGILSLGLNMQYGLAGQANFGFVALFAAGAFAAALVVLPPRGTKGYDGLNAIGLHLPWIVALFVAVAVTGLLALLMGLVCLRLGGHYLAMVTFALGQVFLTFLGNEDWLTGGQFGLSPVPQPLRSTVNSANSYIYLYLGIVAAATVICYLIAHRASASPFGRVLRGVREDEVAARALGKPVGSFKLKAFVLGGVLAGIGGAMWVGSIGAVHVGQFVPIVTFDIWLAVLLGGLGNNAGVLLGALVLVVIQQGTRFLQNIPGLADLTANNPGFLPSLRYVIIGLVLILVVRFAPRGVIPERLQRRRRIGPRPESPNGALSTAPAELDGER